MKRSDFFDNTINRITLFQKFRRIKAHSYTCRSSHCYDRSRQKRHSLRKLAYDICNIKDQMISNRILSQLPVYNTLYFKDRLSLDFICRNNPWSDRSKIIKTLSEIPLLVPCLKLACRNIIYNRISENIIICFLSFDPFASLPIITPSSHS